MQIREIDLQYKLLWPLKYFKAPTNFSYVKEKSIPKDFKINNGSFDETLTVAFLGDLMGVGDKKIFIDDELKNELLNCDKVVFNLESVLKNAKGIILSKQYTYEKSFKHFINQLNSKKVIVGLANNHLYDFGIDGVVNTIKIINECGARYIGTKNHNEISLASGLILKASTIWRSPHDNIVNTYSKNSNQKIINFIHWGEEFSKSLSKDFRYKLDGLLEESICIIGHHSHSPGPIEIINNVLTAHSLGNLATAFKSERINNGLILKIIFAKKNKQWFLKSSHWDYLKIIVEKDLVILNKGNL